jgi:hypothetical protein
MEGVYRLHRESREYGIPKTPRRPLGALKTALVPEFLAIEWEEDNRR